MSASFKITFATEGGTDYVLNISDCKEQLEAPDVRGAIALLIESNAIDTPYGKPTFAKKAALYTPVVTKYNLK